MTDLLPCPFCGGQAEILSGQMSSGCMAYGVLCQECASRGDIYDTEAEAVDAWNTRAERTCRIEFPYFDDAPVINGQPRCSECKKSFAVGTFPNYCPECGAKVVDV